MKKKLVKIGPTNCDKASVNALRRAINEIIDVVNEKTTDSPEPVMCDLGSLNCGQRCDFRKTDVTLCANDAECPFKSDNPHNKPRPARG